MTAKTYYLTRLILCPICNHPMMDLAPIKPLPPFWRRPFHFLAFPFTEGGWVLFLGWPVAAVVLRFLAAPVLEDPDFFLFIGQPMFLYALYFSLLATVGFRLVAQGEEGKLGMLAGGDFESFLHSFFKPVWNFWGAMVSAFMPFVLMHFFVYVFWTKNPLLPMEVQAHPFMIAFNVAFLVFGFSLLPMALLVLGVTENFKNIQNPLFLLGEIRKVSREYNYFLLFFYGLLGVYGGDPVLPREVPV